MRRILQDKIPGFIYIYEGEELYSAELLFSQERPKLSDALSQYGWASRNSLISPKSVAKFRMIQKIFWLIMCSIVLMYVTFIYLKSYNIIVTAVWSIPALVVAFIIAKIFKKILLCVARRSTVEQYSFKMNFDTRADQISIHGGGELFTIYTYTFLELFVSFKPYSYWGLFETMTPARIDTTSVFVHIREKIDAYREKNHIEYRSGLRQSQVNFIIHSAGGEFEALTAGLNEVLNLVRHKKSNVQSSPAPSSKMSDFIKPAKPQDTNFNPMD